MGIICGSGVYFILGWCDMPEDEVVSRLRKLCHNIGSDETERCLKCGSSDCFLKDSTYGMRIWFIDRDSIDDHNYYNFQLKYDQENGWVIEYHIDCSELYFVRARSEFSKSERNAMRKVALKVSELLDMTDFTLLPFPYADVFNG